MTLFLVDQEKCRRDGACVEACPMGIIELRDRQSLPGPIPGAEALCIRCGHCVAVCPHGAMSHRSMTPDQCVPIQERPSLDPQQVEGLLKSRRSIRAYRPDAIGRSLMVKLIDIGRYAPSGHNVQPVQWLVIYDTVVVRSLSGLVIDWMRHMVREASPLAKAIHMDHVIASWEAGKDRICRGAPHVIVVHAPGEERTAPAACTIALAYVELAALGLGLGACWAGYFNAAANAWRPMAEALGLPPGHASFGAMMIGYPKARYCRIPLRNEPLVTWCG